MHRLLLLSGSLALLAGCAAVGDTDDLTRLQAEYCSDTGLGRTTPNTRITVQNWDDEATTAGHRGVLTDDRMGAGQATPNGC